MEWKNCDIFTVLLHTSRQRKSVFRLFGVSFVGLVLKKMTTAHGNYC